MLHSLRSPGRASTSCSVKRCVGSPANLSSALTSPSLSDPSGWAKDSYTPELLPDDRSPSEMEWSWSLSSARRLSTSLPSSIRSLQDRSMVKKSSPAMSSGTSPTVSSLGARELLPHVSFKSSASRISASESTSSASLVKGSWSSSSIPFRKTSSKGRRRRTLIISAWESAETSRPSTFTSSSFFRTPCRAAQLCCTTACTCTGAGGSARGNQPIDVKPSGTRSVSSSSEAMSVIGLGLDSCTACCGSSPKRRPKHISHLGGEPSLR
mmetsp:Transcript_45722/g.127456  ORF Transcript_45722/g.127456 Transcript_45722/m.127456 type:complete len:267 (-) Transcript_45722:129-929(-)